MCPPNSITRANRCKSVSERPSISPVFLAIAVDSCTDSGEGETQFILAVSIDNILSGAILSTSDLWPLTTKPPSNEPIGQLISADVSRILGIDMDSPPGVVMPLLSVLPIGGEVMVMPSPSGESSCSSR